MKKFVWNKAYANIWRRAVAMMLTVSLLCSLMVPALAAEAMPAANTGDHPGVTVEGNAVIDTNGNFTGFFELALKVRTEFYFDGDDKETTADAAGATTQSHAFHSAAVALRYNADLLTPVDWTTDAKAVDVTGAGPGAFVSLDTKKPDDGIRAAATVESYTAKDTAAGTPATALLTLSAGASADVVYTEETEVCVVRFKFNDDPTLVPDPVNADVVDPNCNVFMYALAPDTTPDTTATLPANPYYAVWLAEDAEAAETAAGQVVWYEGSGIGELRAGYYYFRDAEDYITAGSETAVPDTDGAVFNAGTTTTGDDYLSNLLTLKPNPADGKRPAGRGLLKFDLVNKLSYADTMNLDNLVTILFYDWDNTLINVLTAEKGDVRRTVNDHVRTTMIHPDIIEAGENVDSLAREHTYRGAYPHISPTSGDTVTDGEDYPLTNKLDYAFYRRAVTKNADYPTTGEQWLVTTNADADKAYPYASGWALVDDVKNIENVWTTFGAGELGAIDPTGDFTTTGTEADYFQFADFSDLDSGVYYVKACYEPGTLLDKPANYTTLGDVSYSRYYNIGSTGQGSAFSIKYQYGRVGADGRGVGRTRDPAIKLYYTVDREGLADQNFYVEVLVDNADVIDVEFTPTGNFLTMQYALVERYGANFVTGGVRTSYGNDNDILKNFNYDKGWSYDSRLGSEGFVYVGTAHQIFEEGTKAVQSGDSTEFDVLMNVLTFKDLNLRMDQDGQELTSDLMASTYADRVLDLIQWAWNSNDASLRDKDGNVKLDWHQLQYHIIHYDETNGSNRGAYQSGTLLSPEDCAAADGGYLWCHQDECGGGADAITNLNDMLKAALKVVSGSNPDALNALEDLALVNGQHLRADEKGNPFTNVDDFKAALEAAVRKLTESPDGGATPAPYNETTITTVPWDELQYALIHGAYAESSTITEDHWWEGGGAPSVNTLAQLLEVAFKGYADGHDPGILDNIDRTTATNLFLRSDAEGVTFATDDAFRNALERAMNLLKDAGYTVETISGASWLELQHVLIPGNGYRTYNDLDADGTIDYWWENGGKPTLNDEGDLMKYAYRVYMGGEDVSMLGTLTTTLSDDFYLMSDLDGTPFANAAAASSALAAAVRALTTSPDGGATPAPYDGTSIATASWKEIQYALIHGAYAADSAITEDYWWYDGGAPTINSLETLLKYASRVYLQSGDSALLTNATLELADALYLRTDNSGTKFSTRTALLNRLKAAVQALVNSGPYTAEDVSTAPWEELQYALITGSYKSAADIEADTSIDYWWEAGGSKPIEDLDDLLLAAFLVYGNGSDPAALEGITNENVQTFAGDPFWLRREKEDGASFATAAAFKTALEDMITEAKRGGYNTANSIQTLTWLQVQHMMLGNAYATDSSLSSDVTINYWWYGGGEKPEGGEDVEVVMTMIFTLASQLNQDWICELDDPALLTDLVGQYIGGLAFQDAGGTTYTDVSALQAKVEEAVALVYEMAWNQGDPAYEVYINVDTGYVNLTWNQMQYYLINGDLTEAPGDYAWRPATVAAADAAAVEAILFQMEANQAEELEEVLALLDQVVAAMAADPANAAAYLDQFNALSQKLNDLLAFEDVVVELNGANDLTISIDPDSVLEDESVTFDPETSFDPETDAEVVPDTGLTPEPDVGTDTDTDTGTDPDTGTDEDTGTDPDAGTDPDTGTDTDTGTDPDTGTEPDAGTDKDTGTDTDDGTAADPETGTEVPPDTETEIDPGAPPETEETPTDPGAQPETDASDTGGENAPAQETTPSTDSGGESDPDPGGETATESDSDPGAETPSEETFTPADQGGIDP